MNEVAEVNKTRFSAKSVVKRMFSTKLVVNQRFSAKLEENIVFCYKLVEKPTNLEVLVAISNSIGQIGKVQAQSWIVLRRQALSAKE